MECITDSDNIQLYCWERSFIFIIGLKRENGYSVGEFLADCPLFSLTKCLSSELFIRFYILYKYYIHTTNIHLRIQARHSYITLVRVNISTWLSFLFIHVAHKAMTIPLVIVVPFTTLAADYPIRVGGREYICLWPWRRNGRLG